MSEGSSSISSGQLHSPRRPLDSSQPISESSSPFDSLIGEIIAAASCHGRARRPPIFITWSVLGKARSGPFGIERDADSSLMTPRSPGPLTHTAWLIIHGHRTTCNIQNRTTLVSYDPFFNSDSALDSYINIPVASLSPHLDLLVFGD